MKYIFLLFLGIISLFFIGCNDQPTCIPEQTDMLKLLFIDKNGKPKKITFVSLTVDDSSKSFPVFKDTTNSSFELPLNPLDSIILIRFEQDTISNYLALSYKATPVVLNPACAIETKFDFLKIDSTNFDNIVVVDPLLSLETLKNIEITH